MSFVAEQSAAEAAQRLSDLAKEYTSKLVAVKEAAYALVKPASGQPDNRADRAMRHRDLLEYLRTMRPASEQLIREASQMVEHGAIDSTIRVELRLRLAELEHALSSTRTVLQGVSH